MILAHIRAGQVDLRTQGPQLDHLLLRHFVGDHQQHAVAFGAPYQGETEPSVPGGGFHEDPARPQPTLPFGLADHGQSDAVFYGSPWILGFQLEEQLAGTCVDPADSQERGMADQV